MKWHHARAILHGAYEIAVLLLIFAAIFLCFALLGGPVK